MLQFCNMSARISTQYIGHIVHSHSFRLHKGLGQIELQRLQKHTKLLHTSMLYNRIGHHSCHLTACNTC